MTQAEKRISNRAEAQRLFFVCNNNIKDIAAALELHIQTVRGYLRTHEDYNDEKQRRQAKRQNGRRDYKRNWMSNYRLTGGLGSGEIEKAMLKNQHIRDVGVLTFEKF